MELSRIADEAHGARERLGELIREAVALREKLATFSAEPPRGDEAPARKLHSVQ